MRGQIVIFKKTFEYECKEQRLYIIDIILIEGFTCYWGRNLETDKLQYIYPNQVIDIVKQRKIAK